MRIRIALLAAVVSLPLQAEVDLAGEWANRVHEDQPERGPGHEIGDFAGLPINAAARQRGMGWDASLLTVPEHQCGAHPANYGAMHSNIRIWKAVEPQSQQKERGQTLAQIKAAKPTLDYDSRFGRNPEWTGDDFIEAVYASLGT